MDTLTVLKFPEADGADRMIHKLEDLQKQELIQIVDAAIVSWPQGKSKPRTRQLNNLAGFGALDGAFWGLLFGLIFFVPIFGMAIGTLMGGMSGAFADIGIDDDFINEVRENVTEGTSALFLLSRGAIVDRVAEEAKGLDCEIIEIQPAQGARREAARGLRCVEEAPGMAGSQARRWGREQGYVEAAQKELDAQPIEEVGAAGRRERGGGAKRARSVKGRGERAAREMGQKEHARGFGQELRLNRVEPRALRLEEETRGGEDDDLYRKYRR